jgi:putative transposase
MIALLDDKISNQGPGINPGHVQFGGMAKSQLFEMKALEKENTRLKKIPLGGASLACRAMVPELELDKLILKESLDFLMPRA